MGEDTRTLYCGNLSNRCNESLLYELFLQGGPLERVHIPKDRDGSQKSFGFITYKHSESVPYAISLFEGTALFNRTLTLKARQVPEAVPPPPQYQMPIPMNYPNPNQVLQFGNPMFMGSMPNFGMNMIPMFLPPGVAPYPSQINSSSFVKDDRRGPRSHPYHSRDRDRERDRNRDRERSDRDRNSDYDHGHRNQNHRRDHRSQHRGPNDHSRHNRHYR